MSREPLNLSDPKIQLLANWLLTSSSHELKPTVSSDSRARYLPAEKLTGDDATVVAKWLEELARCGILEKRFALKLVLCPKCNSTDLPTTYSCPQCNSVDIERKSIFQHFACGKIGRDEDFRKNGSLICPHCAGRLGERGVTHETVGTWFFCRSCGYSFERPQSSHVCNKCKNVLAANGALFLDVFSYRLSHTAETELRNEERALKPLRDALEELEYEVSAPGIMQGSSGSSIRYDIVGMRNHGIARETVAVDVRLAENLVDERAVVELFAKRLDTRPTDAVLVAVPAMLDAAKKLAAMYKIKLVEAQSLAEAAKKLKASLTP